MWLDEDDPHANPVGAKGIGETGIVGAAAAVATAAHHATGVRVRDLPIHPDRLLRSARRAGRCSSAPESLRVHAGRGCTQGPVSA